MSSEKISKKEFEKHYKVVGGYINSATLYALDRNGGMTDKEIITNEEFENNYWAIVYVDDDGWYSDTIEDDFKSAEDAWKRYDEMKGELCE